VIAPVACVPLTGSVPDHAPEAVHEVASVEDQLSVVLPPLAMLVGFESIVTVGDAAGGVDFTALGVTATVGLGCAVGVAAEVPAGVLVAALALVVLTPEPHADNPAANANIGSKCRMRSRACMHELPRGSLKSVPIGIHAPTSTFAAAVD
jgi:hypothetical protein